MNLTSAPGVFGQPVYSSSPTQLMSLGVVAMDTRGRKYRYVQAGAAPLVTGNLVQGVAPPVGHQNLVVPTGALKGADSVTATLGATPAVVANQYADGLLVVEAAAGLGFGYAVQAHPAAAGAASLAINLYDDDPIQVALTAASRVSLFQHPCRGVVQSPGAATGVPIGLVIHPLAANEYGWVGIEGDFPALIEGAPAVGQALSPGTVAGSVGVNTTTLAIVGRAMVLGVTGKVQPIWVQLG